MTDPLQTAARPLTGASRAYDALLERIGDSRFVLIGEASHGTHEFYRARARLTRRLIQERGFTAVAAEADWPDASRVNRWVRGGGEDGSAQEALGDFTRFPRWLWRNEDVRRFVAWLREHTRRHPGQEAGFHGLDLYSLHRSMRAVTEYLEGVDPGAAARARERYACFDGSGGDPQTYGHAAEHGHQEPCEAAAAAQLLELQRRGPDPARGPLGGDDLFSAQQNARLVQNAERYSRAVFRGRGEAWNIRDTHMAGTLAALVAHGEAQGRPQKIVVWAHNSHLGDARASEMGWARGQLNLGQLTRERWPDSTFILGQTTHHGSVTASGGWDEPARTQRVRPGLPGSLEERLHAVGGDFWLDLRRAQVARALGEEVLQRFIGVIYRPGTERRSHYVLTRPADMYDALLHFDGTTALVPLDATAGAEEEGEVPETYPTGL